MADPLGEQVEPFIDGPEPAGTSAGDPAIRAKLFSFFVNFHSPAGVYIYKEGIRDLYSEFLAGRERGEDPFPNFLEVSVEDVQASDADLAEQLIQNPKRVLSLMTQAAALIATDDEDEQAPVSATARFVPKIAVVFRGVGGAWRPSSLTSQQINRLVGVRAIVSGTSRVRSKTQIAVARCRSCGHVYAELVPQGLETIVLPAKCRRPQVQGENRDCGTNPYVLDPHECTYVDQQTLKLQDIPGDGDTTTFTQYGPAGMVISPANANRATGDSQAAGGAAVSETPIVLSAILEDYLVEQNLLAGSKVLVTGVLCASTTSRSTYLLVTGITDLSSGNDFEAQFSLLSLMDRFSQEEIDSFRAFAASPNLYRNIVNSICPQLLGMENAKLAAACLLFGGTSKHTTEGIRLRGDINVLYVSDPGLGKSELLKWVTATAGVGIYTSGKTASAVGLTAGVMRDKITGEFYLEGGALVLADNGVVAIDEIDKANEKDRVALHESMEQGSISISKAGITATLNTRTSIIAAANPSLGRFDDYKAAADQLDFTSTILSRFDLIFILKDRPDVAVDSRIVDMIGNISMNAAALPPGAKDQQFLSRYIKYAKATCRPRLTPEAASRLESHYVRVRSEEYAKKGIPITVRQLEAMIRTSEAFAKMALRDTVLPADVERSIEIFRHSTEDAAQSGIQEYILQDQTLMRGISEAEHAIKSRIPRGGVMLESSLMRDLSNLGLSDGAVARAIYILTQNGTLERLSGRQLRRK